MYAKSIASMSKSYQALFVVALIAFISLALMAYSTQQKNNVLHEGPTIEMQPRDEVKSIYLKGAIEPVEIVNIGAQINGKIDTILVKQGQHVKAGQELIIIDPRLQQAALEKAQMAFEAILLQKRSKEALFKHKEGEVQRLEMLWKMDAILLSEYEKGKLEMETAKIDLELVENSLKQAELDVANAKMNGAFARIISPIEGVVISIPAKNGQIVNSTYNAQTLIVVANLAQMRVKVKIPESDVHSIQIGDEVSFSITGYKQHDYQGRLEAIDIPFEQEKLGSAGAGRPLQSEAVLYEGTFTIDNSNFQLLPKMSGVAKIEIQKVQDVLSIPISAIKERLPDNRKATVYVISADGSIVNRIVSLGEVFDSGNIHITDGLSIGDKVVVQIHSKIDEMRNDSQGQSLETNTGDASDLSTKQSGIIASKVPHRLDRDLISAAYLNANKIKRQNEKMNALKGAIDLTLNQFAKDWSTGDVEKYFSHYDEKFKLPSRFNNREAWENDRRKRVRREMKIHVALEQVKVVSIGDHSAVVRFTQYYKSRNYSDSVEKEMLLKKNTNGVWKILDEVVIQNLPH